MRVLCRVAIVKKGDKNLVDTEMLQIQRKIEDVIPELQREIQFFLHLPVLPCEIKEKKGTYFQLKRSQRFFALKQKKY